MKNSSDTVGNRTRDLPASSAVPQPSVPLRAVLPVQVFQFAYDRTPVTHYMSYCVVSNKMTDSYWSRNYFE
jgi:hypothetical protein